MKDKFNFRFSQWIPAQTMEDFVECVKPHQEQNILSRVLFIATIFSIMIVFILLMK